MKMDSEHMQGEKDFSLLRNLRDAGCGPLLIEKILALHEDGKIREEMRLLAAQRVILLKKMHAAQEKIDCLDYLIFHLRQESTILTRRKQ